VKEGAQKGCRNQFRTQLLESEQSNKKKKKNKRRWRW